MLHLLLILVIFIGNSLSDIPQMENNLPQSFIKVIKT